MSSPYVGELRLVGFTFAPYGWALCQGQLVAISQNDTLFNLIGTTYGGDGQQTFGLPDLRSRISVHQGALNGGSTYVMGQRSGVENVTIGANQYPIHNHVVVGNTQTTGNVANPSNAVLAGGQNIYRAQAPGVAMAGDMLGVSGGSQPHSNLQPYLALNWIISLFGIFPSPS